MPAGFKVDPQTLSPALRPNGDIVIYLHIRPSCSLRLLDDGTPSTVAVSKNLPMQKCWPSALRPK